MFYHFYTVDFYIKEQDCFGFENRDKNTTKSSLIYSDKEFAEKMRDELAKKMDFWDLKFFVLELETEGYKPVEKPNEEKEIEYYSYFVKSVLPISASRVVVKRFKTEAVTPSFESQQDKKFWLLKERFFPKAPIQTYKNSTVLCLDAVNVDSASMFANHGDWQHKKWETKILLPLSCSEDVWKIEEILDDLGLLEENEMDFTPCILKFESSMVGHVYFLPSDEDGMKQAAKVFWAGIYRHELDKFD